MLHYIEIIYTLGNSSPYVSNSFILLVSAAFLAFADIRVEDWYIKDKTKCPYQSFFMIFGWLVLLVACAIDTPIYALLVTIPAIYYTTIIIRRLMR